MTSTIQSATELLNEYGLFNDSVVGKDGVLIDGFRLGGIEPDSVTETGKQSLAVYLSNLYGRLPDDLFQTQYFVKIAGRKIVMRSRQHPIAASLVQRRESFLNDKQLSDTFLYHFFGARTSGINKMLGRIDYFKSLLSTPFSADARETVSQLMSVKSNYLLSLEDLVSRDQVLSQTMHELGSDLEGFQPEHIGAQGVASFLGFLLTLDPLFLTDDAVPAPLYDWDRTLPGCDIDLITRDGVDYIRYSGDRTRYARILTVSKYIGDKINEGFFIDAETSPLNIPGQYIFMSRYKPLGLLAGATFFESKRSEVERQNIRLSGLLKGSQFDQTEKEKMDTMRKPLRERLEDLDAAQDLSVRWGKAHYQVMMFDTNVDRLNDNIRAMQSSLNRLQMMTTYERAGMGRALIAGFPSDTNAYYRDLDFNTTQYAATSLVFKSSSGLPVVKDYNNEEFLYPFEAKDGSIFHYTPFINGRGLVVSIGPIRSGKSFFRATLATHFGKYGGFLRMIDVDPGSEPVALCYGEDGAIFRVDDETGSGFNLFTSATGENDTNFIAHLGRTIRNLLSLNDSEEMKKLTPSEQRELDQSIMATLALPKEMQTLTTLSKHCSKDVQSKMSRFLKGGIYGDIFDAEIDAFGNTKKLVAAYNLQALKENEDVMPFVMAEIFYRIVREFEDPQYRQTPKYADFDEAHVPLSVPGVAENIIRRVRTWGKWLGGISLTTQSPHELNELGKEWTVLRSAASTFVFFADPEMDEDLYRETFKLTDAELRNISRLRPRSEAYIIQRDIGVSKTVLVDVEPEQYVINTSRPDEATIRNINIENYGFDEGIRRTCIELDLIKQESTNNEIVEA